MTERVFDEYSAREFIDWIDTQSPDEYIKQVMVNLDDDTIMSNAFDIELLKRNFLYNVHRYTVVKRGYKFYIHDERQCMDIMMFRYTDSNEEEIQNHVNDVCNDLNSGKVIFIGKKHHMCD